MNFETLPWFRMERGVFTYACIYIYVHLCMYVFIYACMLFKRQKCWLMYTFFRGINLYNIPFLTLVVPFDLVFMEVPSRLPVYVPLLHQVVSIRVYIIEWVQGKYSLLYIHTECNFFRFPHYICLSNSSNAKHINSLPSAFYSSLRDQAGWYGIQE